MICVEQTHQDAALVKAPSSLSSRQILMENREIPPLAARPRDICFQFVGLCTNSCSPKQQVGSEMTTSSRPSVVQAVEGRPPAFSLSGRFAQMFAGLINPFAVSVSPDDSGARGGAAVALGDSEHAPELAGKLGEHRLKHCLERSRERELHRRGRRSHINKHTTGCLAAAKMGFDRVETWLLAGSVIGWVPPPLPILSVLQLNASLLAELSVHIHNAEDAPTADGGPWLSF